MASHESTDPGAGEPPLPSVDAISPMEMPPPQVVHPHHPHSHPHSDPHPHAHSQHQHPHHPHHPHQHHQHHPPPHHPHQHHPQHHEPPPEFQSVTPMGTPSNVRSESNHDPSTKHRCDLSFCRRRMVNMRKVKRPKNQKAMQRYADIWVRVGGYPENVNDTGRVVTHKAQFYFCPEHIKPREDGGLYRAYTVDDFLPRTLAPGGDPIWRTITPQARQRYRGDKTNDPEMIPSLHDSTTGLAYPALPTSIAAGHPIPFGATTSPGGELLVPVPNPQTLISPQMHFHHPGTLMPGNGTPQNGSVTQEGMETMHANSDDEVEDVDVDVDEGDEHDEQDRQEQQRMLALQAGLPFMSPNVVLGRVVDHTERLQTLRMRHNIPPLVPDEFVDRFSSMASDCAEALRQKARLEAELREVRAQLDHYRTLAAQTAPPAMASMTDEAPSVHAGP
ncbi:uncharacterized protein MONBRDRAFT_9576 [Monosiga brevicollis MX1]|uniref:Uncharacterized protein n=1 Tax=Monosiga brevicollis TaxID=81824 RepID=A9V3R0_MONBE|nr:uncharacterized protein MONBRDRAFT_9576 [Monosiga brevicollis MX1]EDQ87854.1 predicted protein [Monosiga brevicollis MX1]|eukprot:XP_001747387.1 hypothetical protein [Monosiga brevicollis MX1]